MTSVILLLPTLGGILCLPTTEPGRRGWNRRLGSLISAPIFCHQVFTTPTPLPQHRIFHRVELCLLLLRLLGVNHLRYGKLKNTNEETSCYSGTAWCGQF